MFPVCEERVKEEGGNVNGDILRLDNIALQGFFVPEPDSPLLVALGTLLVRRSHRRRINERRVAI